VFHGRPDDTGPYAANAKEHTSGGDNPLVANGVSGESGATNLEMCIRDRTCTHQTVLRQVWGDSYGAEADYLRVYVYRLRKKLGKKGGPLLRTSPGIGYCLSAG